MVKLGSKVRDRITGFEGTATGRAEYLNGCIKILVEGRRGTDGKENVDWFDEQRLDAKSAAKNGGPMPTPATRDPR